jgi:hypothetical protein
LHQAVRAGIQLIPDPAPTGRYFGVSAATGRLGCDALAAAWFAEYYDGERNDQDPGLGSFLSEDLAKAYPQLRLDLGPNCPWGPTSSCSHSNMGRSLEQKIIHLQDRHQLSREKVADWLQVHSF